jgi:hypothetical protein
VALALTLAFGGQGSERLSNSRASEGNSEHTYLGYE